MEAWLGWAIYAAVGVLIIGFSLWFVRYYKLRDEPSGVTGMIGFLALLFALLSLFLIPIDVYMCPQYDDGNNYRDNAKYTYYAFYCIFLFFLFIGIPFGYFYYEELGDLQDRSNTFTQKACNSLKYTAVTAILWLTLIIIGMFVNFSSGVSNDSQDAWTHVISDRFNKNIDGIMPFSIAVVTACGMFFSMIYTAWGLAAFPISLIRPMGKYETVDKNNIQYELSRCVDDLDMLNTKYRGKDRWPPKDIAKKNALVRRKKTLEKKEKLASEESAATREPFCDRVGRCFWSVSAPIRYLIGIALLGFSLCLMTSLIMHLIDQVINSSCGYSCGFALNDPKLAKYDPVSWMLSNAADYFPVDYIFFTGIIFWIFWCTIFGLMMIDVRFLCFKLFSLRPHETMHNALLMAIGFLLLILTSFNYLMMNFAAQYMTFGNQSTDCAIDCGTTPAPTEATTTTTQQLLFNNLVGSCQTCPGSEIYYLISGILIGMPIFGLVYFVFTWIFVLVFFISVLYNLYRKPKGKNRLLRNHSDDDLEAIFKD